MVEKLARRIIDHRIAVIIILSALSIFFAWEMRGLKIKSDLNDLLPQNHPFIKIHKQYEEQLGSPFKVFLMMAVKKGDIYNSQTLRKIKDITDALDLIPGVNHDQIYSLSSRKVKKITVTQEGIFAEDMMPEVPETVEKLALFRETVRNTRGVQGVFVSPNEKCALFTISFIPRLADYQKVFQKVRELIEKESDAGHTIYAAGEPILMGWIYQYQKEMYFIFGVTFAAFICLMGLYFRNLMGVVVHIPPIVLGVVWFLGLCGLLGYHIEPLTLVIPLLITARSLSHSIQFTERYFEVYQESKGVKESCIKATTSILPAGTLGIVTDSLGILLIAVAPIPMLQKLAYLCGFWAFSIIFTGQLLTPVLISFFPPPVNIDRIVDPERGVVAKILGVTARMCYGKAGIATFVIAVFLAAFTGWMSSKVEVGDIHPGTPILWEDSDYNLAVARINRNFPGTEELNVIFTGKIPKEVESPEFLKILDSFQKHMEKSPGITRTLSVADFISPLHKYVYGGYPKWQTLPETKEEAGQLFHLLLGRSSPSDYNRYISGDTRMANVIIWCRDHMGDTVRSVIAQVKEFKEDNEDLLVSSGVELQLASGNIGVLAAMNEVIAESQLLNFFLVMGVIFVLCSFAFRSVVAALILTVPLNMANLITLSVMYCLGIGLNVNTLPIVSVGVGVGIDYGIYLLSRICEEYQISGEYSLSTATTALKTTGKAIFFTATAMISGVIFWYFLSQLKFQAEMGLLLAIIMLVNMIGALVLIPSLIYIFKPKFLGKEVRLLVGR